jgi:hypothetical protein
MDKKLHNAIKKCTFEFETWCGYLQSAEIILLFDNDLIWPNLKSSIDSARENIKKGKANPTWIYFQPRGDFIELHRGLSKKNKPKKMSW